VEKVTAGLFLQTHGPMRRFFGGVTFQWDDISYLPPMSETPGNHSVEGTSTPPSRRRRVRLALSRWQLTGTSTPPLWLDAAKGYEAHLAAGGKMLVTLAARCPRRTLGISLAEMIRRPRSRDRLHRRQPRGRHLQPRPPTTTTSACHTTGPPREGRAGAFGPAT